MSQFSEEYAEEIERFIQEACEYEDDLNRQQDLKLKSSSICKDEWYKINDSVIKCMSVIRVGDMDIFSCLTFCSISCEPILKNFVFDNSGLLSGEFEVIKTFEHIEEQGCLCWWDSREMQLIAN